MTQNIFRLSSHKVFLGIVTTADASIFTASIPNKDEERQFTPEEVREYDGRNGTPLFVTFRGAVYDVTKFSKEHPGGNLIMQAAGNDVEPFWNKWAYHYHSKKVQNILKDNRVGSLIMEDKSPMDIKNENDSLPSEENLYKYDPKRTNEHKVLMQRPFTSETWPESLKGSYITPTSALYVRNHAPVPTNLDFTTDELTLSKKATEDDEGVTLNIPLKEIFKNYKTHEVTAVLQCAGNRAGDYIEATGDSGFVGTPFANIQIGMVGNILWSGVLLKDVLQKLFPSECIEESNNTEDVWHVIFEGADDYETSTPLSYILDEKTSCILANKMNGEALSSDHGYPVRAILPGVAGARCVKWLQSISISKSPSESPWNSHYYRKSDGSHIQHLPLNSIILSPKNGDYINYNKGENKTIDINGIAYSGGSGKRIKSVELSVDNGKNWFHATLLSDELQNVDLNKRSYSWVRFHSSFELQTISKHLEDNDFVILSRAVDEDGLVQPEISKKERGYLYNAWHKVKLKAC